MEDVLTEKLSKVTSFDLPLIASAIPFKCHPDFAKHCKAVDEWGLNKLNITDPIQRKKYIQARLGLFTSMLIPMGEATKVQLCLRHTWLLFVVDDIAESTLEDPKGKRVADVLLRVAQGEYVLNEEEKLNSPTQGMFEEVISSLRALMPPRLFARYLICLEAYLTGVRKEASLHAANCIPVLEEYQENRRQTTFLEACAGILGEFAMDLKLDEGVVESPEFVAFLNAVIDHVYLVNDLFSFRKEFNTQCYHNYLCIMWYHSPKNTSFQDIVNKVCNMIQETETKILQLQKKLISQGQQSGNKDLVKYAECLPYVASGNLRWSYVTARYHGVDNPLLTGEPFHGTWFLHPDRTIILSSECVDHPFIIIEG